jgi:hypothetical protein
MSSPSKSYLLPCYTQSQILCVVIDKDSQSAIDDRKIRSNRRCTLSDVSKRSRLLRKKQHSSARGELEAGSVGKSRPNHGAGGVNVCKKPII